MNYLSTFIAYIIGMFVPYITSTAIILGINKKNIDRATRLDIFRTNCLIEGSSVVMAYYGIRSSKSSISIEMDDFANIDGDLLWTMLITIALVIGIYLFAIQIYMFVPKGKTYKGIAALYIVSYIYMSIGIWATALMIGISFFSIYLLKNAPPISRSLSFVLTAFIR
jgi:hypothetical protein